MKFCEKDCIIYPIVFSNSSLKIMIFCSGSCGCKLCCFFLLTESIICFPPQFLDNRCRERLFIILKWNPSLLVVCASNNPPSVLYEISLSGQPEPSAGIFCSFWPCSTQVVSFILGKTISGYSPS